MSPFRIGIVMPIAQAGPDRTVARWSEAREIALRAEALGFDTVWTPDELLWQTDDGPPRGVWDGVSIAAAVAVVTTQVTVGTWVLAALHRNPGIIAKTAETIDELSGGRFICGLGAGHAWPGQAKAFGLPEDHIFDRFDEALAIIVPLLREGRADFEGTYHAARDLVQQPQGPRPGGIPLLIGGNGPKGQRHAVRHADIYSCYVEEHATPDEVRPRIESLEAICAEEGRDPATIGRSVGVGVNGIDDRTGRDDVLWGPAERIADGLRAFRDAGFTRAELMFGPGTLAGLEALAPVLELLRADEATAVGV